MLKRLLALLMAALLIGLICPASAEESAEDGAFPPLNEAGFLDEGEFLFEDEEAGVWRYAGQTLRVEIIRRTQEKPRQIWYEAEVWSRDGDVFRMIANNPEKRMKSQEYPYKIARKNRTVLAINSDFAQLRITQKKRVGILLRDGEILSDRTLAKNKGTFPNLDTLALFPDGDMQVFYSDEKTAEEYVEMGALDVLAFGPLLIRDGALNEAGLKKYGTSSAQRTAIGMVEKGHYFAMMLEGRHTNSRGAGISFLAERLLEKGCTVAFNLDGGQTSTIVFMGHQLCQIGKTKRNASSRKTAEILGIGTSDLVRALDDPW